MKPCLKINKNKMGMAWLYTSVNLRFGKLRQGHNLKSSLGCTVSKKTKDGKVIIELKKFNMVEIMGSLNPGSEAGFIIRLDVSPHSGTSCF